MISDVLQRHHFYPYGSDLDALFASGGGPGGGFTPADSLIIVGPGIGVIGGNGVGPGDGASPQGGGSDGGELIDVGDTPSAQTSTSLPYRFSGKERLDRAGLSLYDFGARLYNPAASSGRPDTESRFYALPVSVLPEIYLIVRYFFLSPSFGTSSGYLGSRKWLWKFRRKVVPSFSCKWDPLFRCKVSPWS